MSERHGTYIQQALAHVRLHMAVVEGDHAHQAQQRCLFNAIVR
jgi:hypothetical protein